MLVLTEPSFWRFYWVEKSADDELSSNTSSSFDVELLQLAVEREGPFNSIVQRYRVRVVEEGDEEDEDVYTLRP